MPNKHRGSDFADYLAADACVPPTFVARTRGTFLAVVHGTLNSIVGMADLTISQDSRGHLVVPDLRLPDGAETPAGWRQYRV